MRFVLEQKINHLINLRIMQRISIRYGLLMLAGFVTLYLIMYVIGLGHRSEFRILNGFVHLYCIYKAIQAYYNQYPENIGNYLMGVTQGMGASVIGVGGYTAFITIFLALDPTLMNLIRQNSKMEAYLNPYSVSLYILVEGIVVSLIGAYILTRVVDNQVKKEEFKA